MKHTVIIAHRDRPGELALCLESLRRSAWLCEIPPDGLEVLVIDNGSAAAARQVDELLAWPPVRIVADRQPMAVFNKAAILNRGLDLAAGELVSILDADAIVGERWLSAALDLADPAITRIAYRVRRLDDEQSRALLGEPHPLRRAELLAELRARWANRRFWPIQSLEAYGFPDLHRAETDEPGPTEPGGWGNSQFSMRAADLAGLRYDGQFAGHGYEDIDFNRQVWARYRERFVGRIYVDAARGLLHVGGQARRADWYTDEIQLANTARYRAKYPLSCEKEAEL